MPDASTGCARCGSVREGNRWVRRAVRPLPADAVATPPARSAEAGPAPGPAHATAGPDAPTGAPASVATGSSGPTGGPRWGCAVAGLAATGFVGLLAVIAAAALAGRGPGGGPPPATWSPGYVATFESACAATGAEASYCRCLRTGLEGRVPEHDMVRFQRRLVAGSSLAADDRRTFREIESRCGH
jgi:hypothetical protein